MKASSGKIIALVAALCRLATASIGTTTITSIYTTTSVTTSTSTLDDCSVSGMPSINCIDGYYDTYGGKWQEFCAATVTGTRYWIGAALSLRACMAGCATNTLCTGATYDAGARICYFMTGELTITPGGPYQAAYRFSPDYQPCETTIVTTVEDVVTATEVVTYSITPTPTPTPTLSDTSFSSTALSSPAVSPSSPSFLPSPARPVTPSGTPSPRPASLPASSHIPTPSPPPSSAAITSETRTETRSDTSSTSTSNTPSGGETAPGTTQTSSSGADTLTSQTSISETESCTETGPAATETTTSETTQLPFPPTTTAPMAMTTSTVTVTDVHTITACPSSVRNCPAADKTTYFFTETLSIYTTICPVTATETVTDFPTVTTPSPASTTTDAAVETVYETYGHTVIACPSWVTDCPASQQTVHQLFPGTVAIEPTGGFTVIPVDVPTVTDVTAPGNQPATFSTSLATNTSSWSHVTNPSGSGSMIPSSSSSDEQIVSGTSSAAGIIFTGAASNLQTGFIVNIATSLIGVVIAVAAAVL